MGSIYRDGLKQLSSSAYVPAKLRNEDVWIQLPIRSARNCAHLKTICTECRKDWEGDWEIAYDRTAGGRKFNADRKQ